MKKLISVLNSVVVCVLMCCAFASCNDKNNTSVIPDNTCFDFVTFVSSSNTGSVFTFRKSNDSELITLTARVSVDTERLKPGTRVIIQYLPSGGQGAYQSGPIDLYGISEVINGNIEKESLTTINSWRHDNMRVTLTRSGEYLDLIAQAYCNNKPKRLTLAVDESTLEDEYPQLYLVFTTDAEMSRTRYLYASFNISSVWDLPTCKGLKVTYDTNNSKETLTFQKPGHESLQPGGIN